MTSHFPSQWSRLSGKHLLSINGVYRLPSGYPPKPLSPGPIGKSPTDPTDALTGRCFFFPPPL
ncbi:MAG: hypothetical protein HDR75_02150 [Bacteroides sp.]|nr:hypothetical protein [Bacteroides sp.]